MLSYPGICAVSLLLTLLAPGAIAATEPPHAPPERALSAFDEDPARRFDFWIGHWKVNLRMLGEDLAFHDRIAAEAHIYSILDGKAILELWDSGPIKGYSLRHHDPATGKWVLWLSWPGPNAAGMSSLEGAFRHGRGEFRSTYTTADGREILQRYAFTDITPFSLRWDDLNSSDDGRTWRENWRMEFTRLAIDPEWPIDRDHVPTFHDGSRCDSEKFRPYETIVGDWSGENAKMRAYRVLDGCAVMAFLEHDGREEFFFLTWLTRAGQWVTSVLDDRRDSRLARYTSQEAWSELADADGESLHWSVDGEHLTYRRGARTVKLTRDDPIRPPVNPSARPPRSVP